MKIINIFLDNKDLNLEQKISNFNQILNIDELEIINITSKYIKIKNLNSLQSLATYQIMNLNKYNYFAIQKLVKIINENKADIILAYDKKSCLLSKYLNKKLHIKIPIMSICAEYPINDFIGSDSIITPIKQLKKLALEQGQKPHTIYHIPNIINQQTPLIKERKFYKTPIIGFIGNINNNKNLTLLIEALALLKEKSINLKLKVAGTGTKQQKIEDLVISKNLEKQVKFLGWVSKKKNFFNNIDLCYFASYKEYSTLPLIEAINYAKPIIAINNAAVEEIIEHQHTGIIIKENHPEILAKTLELLINDEKLAKKYGLNALKQFNKKFAPKIISEKLINCLNESWLKNKEKYRANNNN